MFNPKNAMKKMLGTKKPTMNCKLDYDGDGLANYKDCSPLNKRKQGPKHTIKKTFNVEISMKDAKSYYPDWSGRSFNYKTKVYYLNPTRMGLVNNENKPIKGKYITIPVNTKIFFTENAKAEYFDEVKFVFPNNKTLVTIIPENTYNLFLDSIKNNIL